MRQSARPSGTTSKRGVLHRLFRGGGGQSLVEFVMVLPIFLILIFAVIDFGMGLRSYISLTNATREGARFAAVGNAAGTYPDDCGVTDTTVVGRVCIVMEGLNLANLQTVTVTYPDGQQPGNDVSVSAQYTYEYITPLGDMMNFISAGSFPDALMLQTSTDMRLE